MTPNLEGLILEALLEYVADETIFHVVDRGAGTPDLETLAQYIAEHVKDNG